MPPTLLAAHAPAGRPRGSLSVCGAYRPRLGIHASALTSQRPAPYTLDCVAARRGAS